MRPGFNETDRISEAGEPRRIWGLRVLSAQHRCSAELVGLAFVAAIRVELDSERTNEQLPRVSKSANQQKPRHCARLQEKSTHRKAPSIFTLSSPSCLKSSATCFSTSCFLCKRPLPSNKDIYMYRGDQAFCTKQCRYHQMAIDESKEKIHLHPSTFTPTKCHINHYKLGDRSFACA